MTPRRPRAGSRGRAAPATASGRRSLPGAIVRALPGALVRAVVPAVAALALGALAAACSRKAPDRSCEGFAKCNADCETGNMGACTRAANAMLTGAGTKTDTARGLALLERACKADEAVACWNLSGRYLTGRGVRRDVKKAESLLDRAVSRLEKECRGGDAQSCAWASGIRRSGRPHVRDEKRASDLEKRTMQLAEAACVGGKVASCELLADVVDRLPDHGLNTSEGVAKLDVACDGGAPMACWRRGSQVQYHLAAPGRLATPEGYYELAVKHYDEQCQAGRVISCTLLGARLDSEGKFLAHPSDPALAYARACDLGDSFSCSYASGWYRKAWRERAPDPVKADAYDRKRFDALVAACDDVAGQSCFDASEWLEQGRGPVAADPARAAALRKRGLDGLENDCRNEDWRACNWLAFDYERGPAADLARSTAMFERACQLGNDEQACTQAKLRKR